MALARGSPVGRRRDDGQNLPEGPVVWSVMMGEDADVRCGT